MSSTSCNESLEFIQQLQARTLRLRLADPSEAAIAFVVDLVSVPQGVSGELVVREPDGTVSVREIPGANCHEVISAMALIAALRVDPFASTAELEPARFRAPEPTPIEPKTAPVPHSPWGLGIAQRLTVNSAIAPGLTPGLALLASVSYELSAIVRPTLRVSGQLARSATVIHPLGSAEFEWTAARVSLCPVRWAVSQRVDFLPCALFDVGRLRGSGFNTVSPTDPSIFWSDAGLEIAFEAAPAGPLTLGVETGFTLPFVRDRFYFAPDTTAHRIPSIGFSAAVGVGLRFF